MKITKKLIGGIVVAVLIIGAFVGSTLYINGINKAHYEMIAQKDISEIKASIASALKPIVESQGLEAAMLLKSIEDLDISMEASPYNSGFLHSKGVLTIKLDTSSKNPSTLYIDANFSNIPFGTSVFSLSSPDLLVKEIFADGKIGAIELEGTTLALRLSDVFIQKDTWRDEKDTFSLKGSSLVLRATKDLAIKDIKLTIPEFVFVEFGKRSAFKNLTIESTYDTPITYQDLIKYVSEGAIFAGKSAIDIESLEFAKRRVGINFERLSLKGKEKLGASANLSNTIMDFALKSLVIAQKHPSYAEEDTKALKLEITDFHSTLELQNLHKTITEYLGSLNNPLMYLDAQTQQKFQEILDSNPKLLIKDSSFSLNGKKLTYSGDGQILGGGQLPPALIEFNFTISSKFSIQELLERYKGTEDFDFLTQDLGQYFVKKGDSKHYSTTLQYHITPERETFKVNDEIIYEEDFSQYNFDEQMLDESILNELDSAQATDTPESTESSK